MNIFIYFLFTFLNLFLTESYQNDRPILEFCFCYCSCVIFINSGLGGKLISFLILLDECFTGLVVKDRDVMNYVKDSAISLYFYFLIWTF